jgi:hypothetical protein
LKLGLKENPAMAVAILVLAYREPFVLSQVVPAYHKAGFDIYVHLDAKASLADYTQAMNGQSDLCRFIPSRQSIFWAGFTMIQATISLLETALSHNKYTNFVLVSDDTLPIIPLTDLHDRLSYTADRISVRPVQDDELFAQRYRRFFFLDHIATSLHGRQIETSAIDDNFIDSVNRVIARKEAGKVQIPLFYGSQWWSLTERTARKVLSSYKENTDLRESFEFSAVPDEMYIQTMIANFVQENAIIRGPVYVDWSRQPRPFVFSSSDQYTQSITAEHFFIRKVTSKHPDFVTETIKKIS